MNDVSPILPEWLNVVWKQIQSSIVVPITQIAWNLAHNTMIMCNRDTLLLFKAPNSTTSDFPEMLIYSINSYQLLRPCCVGSARTTLVAIITFFPEISCLSLHPAAKHRSSLGIHSGDHWSTQAIHWLATLAHAAVRSTTRTGCICKYAFWN